MTKASKLKNLIESNQLSYIMEAHSGLSAKIVEETGFDAIWASGLSISASLGVRDCNEASWTQVLEVAEFMSDATDIPILLDGDTGYGNFNNARRLVRKLEQRGIAGVCIEDKIFPKRNSFINDEHDNLVSISEFSHKIKAVRDSIQDQDFCIIARTEGYIYGRDTQEVLDRAKAYQEAGATAVLVHSKQSTCSEIESFMQQWDDSCPIIIVPTSYFDTDTKVFEKLGISAVIWANHLLRSSVKNMQAIALEIFQQQAIHTVESKISPLSEIFRLQDEHELKQAEDKYLK